MIRAIFFGAALLAFLSLMRRSHRPQRTHRRTRARPSRAFTADTLLALHEPLPVVTELQDEDFAWFQWDCAVAELEGSMGGDRELGQVYAFVEV